MTTALFCSCLLCILPADKHGDFINKVDRIELNHHYDHNKDSGRLILDQVIPYVGEYSNSWHQLLSREDGPVESADPGFVDNPVFKRDNRITWYKLHNKGVWRVIVNDNHNVQYIYETLTEPYETWTNFDPELENRFPTEEGSSYAPRFFQNRKKMFP